MKVLQVMAGGENGGAEMAFVDMCVAMKEAGIHVEVVTRPNRIRIPLLTQAGLPIHTLPFGGVIDKYTPYKIKKIIEGFEPDIVQTWMSRASQKTPNWKVTKTSKQHVNIARLGGYYNIKHFANTDYFVPITPDIGDFLRKNGITDDRMRFIQNFAETEEDAVPVSRESLDTPKDAPVLLTLARLHEAKALDVVLNAVADIPEAYLWMAGEGPLHEQLEKQATDLGIIDRVRFLGWRVDRSALLQAADICLFTSRYEPFGTVFAQSWANKTPVIVSDTFGPKQFCTHEKDCLMITVDDQEALTTSINRLLDDKVLHMSLVKNGYDQYLSHFTKEQSVQSYLSYYRQILDEQSLSNGDIDGEEQLRKAQAE